MIVVPVGTWRGRHCWAPEAADLVRKAGNGSSVIVTPGCGVVRDGLVSIDSALYSSSISLLAAC